MKKRSNIAVRGEYLPFFLQTKGMIYGILSHIENGEIAHFFLSPQKEPDDLLGEHLFSKKLHCDS
jgi:hypothetical protein